MSLEPYAEAVLARRPVAYWRCGEASGDLADSSGNGNTMADAGTPTYGAAGAIRGDGNTAVSLPQAAATYFQAPNSATLDVADIFSIVAWIKVTTIGLQQTILCRPTNGYDFRVDATGHLNLTKTFVASIVNSTTTMVAGAYYMVAVTKTGATVNLYINGVDVTGTVTNATIVANAGITRAGLNAQNGALPFGGSVDEVALWAVALSVADIAALYALGSQVQRQVTTTVIWREPTPPHAAIYVTEPGAVTYQQRIRGAGSAALLVPRTDPNASGIAKLLARCVPMVTIERSDGLLPFVGFAVDPSGAESDAHMQLTLADHTLRLSQASTRLVAESRQASGTMVIAELGDMDVRAEPPLYLDLRYVSQGPSASLALTGQNGDSFLRELERQTGYDAYFTYDISMRGVVTYLQWRQQQGQDRRAEDSWRGGDQLADVRYAIDNRLGLKAATSVGGTGAVSARTSATANATGNRSLGATVAKVATPARGIGGTRVDFIQTVTDAAVLQERSKRALIDPRNSPVRWEFGIVESRVDMTRVGVGDIRVLGSETAFLGQPVEGVARIIAMELHPAEGVLRCVAVEVD